MVRSRLEKFGDVSAAIVQVDGRCDQRWNRIQIEKQF
jgi:hypothetical protein